MSNTHFLNICKPCKPEITNYVGLPHIKQIKEVVHSFKLIFKFNHVQLIKTISETILLLLLLLFCPSSLSLTHTFSLYIYICICVCLTSENKKKICQTVFQSCFIILHSHLEYMRVPISPYLYQHLV